MEILERRDLLTMSPEIGVSVDGQEVYDDDYGSGVYFNSTPVGSPVTKTLVIENTGSADLTLVSNSLTMPPGFSVVTPFAQLVAPGASTSLVIQLNATTAGFFGGQLSFANNDGDENPFDIYVSGQVLGAGGGWQPEIEVLDAMYLAIADGSGSVNFGNTSVGTPISYWFTIYNQGQADLALNATSLSLPSGFSLVVPFDETVIPYGQTYLAVQLDATAAGSYSGELSFANNDADENPFNFTIGGQVTSGPEPEIAVLDSSMAAVADGTGSADFGSTQTGMSIQRTFTIENTGTATLSLDTQSLSVPAGFSVVSSFATIVVPGSSTWMTIQLDATTAGSHSGELSFANSDPDENPYNFTIIGNVTAAPEPEIDVVDASAAAIADGTGTAAFGATPIGTPVEQVFTIKNTGTANLTLDSNSLLLPTGFSLVSGFSSPIAPMQQTSMTVRLNATSVGTYGGELSFANNDGNENPYNFTLTGEVLPTNSAPIVIHPIGDVAVEEGTASTEIALAVVFDDVDIPHGDSLTYSASHDNPGLLSTTINGATLTLTYIAGQLGTANVTLRATDDELEFVEDVFVVKVIAPLEAPVAQNDFYRVNHDTTLSIDPSSGTLNNDIDPNGDALQAIAVTTANSGSLVLNSNGSFDYVPNAGFVGTDWFTYKATDGTHESQPATVTIQVVNTAPLALDDSYSVAANGTLDVPLEDGVLAADFDLEGDTLTATLVATTSYGTLSLSANGAFLYTPNAGFEGTDQFTYRAGDGLQVSEIATVTIGVNNREPVAIGDWYHVRHDSTLTVGGPGVLENDWDADGDALQAVLVTQATHGTATLNSNGSFSYVPDAQYEGEDSFSYKATDPFGESGVATVTVNVVNTTPTARADGHALLHDTTLSVDAATGVLANDSDLDQDAMTATLVTGVSNGTLTFHSDGSFDYAPNPGFVGTDFFSYKAADGLSASTATTVTLTVTNADPIAHDDRFSVHAGQTLTVSTEGVLANDVDLDEETLTVALASNVSNGTLTLNPNGTFLYTPGAGFVGKDSFSYTSSDGAADSDPATVSIEVTNAYPWAVDSHYDLDHDTTLSVGAPGLLDFAGDADEDPLTVSLVQGPASGTLNLSSDGSFTYAPDPGFAGKASFQFRVNDGFADSGPATVTLDVRNLSPFAADDYHRVSHDRVLLVAAPGVLGNDLDDDGLSVTNHAAPSHGTLVILADGSFT